MEYINILSRTNIVFTSFVSIEEHSWIYLSKKDLELKKKLKNIKLHEKHKLGVHEALNISQSIVYKFVI